MEEKAKAILERIKYVTLATVGEDGSPWNSPVFFAYDDDFNIYWSSTPGAAHSQNINRTQQTFIVIYDSTSEAGEGVYLQCTASMLEDKSQIERALTLLGNRRGMPFTHSEKFISGPQRIFRAMPLQVWMNDADKDADGDFIRDYRLSINLQ